LRKGSLNGAQPCTNECRSFRGAAKHQEEDHSMNVTAERRPYLVAVFDSHSEADQAIHDLLASGFTAKEVGFAMRGQPAHLGESEQSEAYGVAAVTRTSTGAVAGAVVGGALGAISALLIPGFGPVLLAGMLIMAAGGSLAGGFAGLMSTIQLTEEEKRYYHNELKAGRCLVFVKTGDRYSEALAILESHGAHDAARTNERVGP
jgi:hypothetical protein